MEQGQRFLAAKRRKNKAHGVSRGYKWEMIQPQRGERGVLTHTLKPPFFLAFYVAPKAVPLKTNPGGAQHHALAKSLMSHLYQEGSMRHVCCAGIISVAMIVSPGSARGQTVSLQEQLSAQYQVAKVKADSSGYGIVDPGTLLTIQKSGVLAVPWKAMALCPAKYQDNAFHPSVGFCAGMLKDVSRYFQKGEKVYPTKIDVNVNKAKVSLTVVACDSCSGTNPATSMKGEVVFQFAKGYLEKAGVGDVEDAIGKVFLIAEENQQNDNQQSQGNGSKRSSRKHNCNNNLSRRPCSWG